ncbi:MAG TPA: sulfotransferase [Dehalococcoidia bacterium]
MQRQDGVTAPERRTPPGTVVCVLGMHRSGTSLTTRLLSLLGLHLGHPDNLMQPHPEMNPLGFWEHQRLTDLNDLLLARLGGSWHEPPPLPEGWERRADLADLRDQALAVLREDFGAAGLWGWKDPRNSLTLPFWRTLLPSMSYVICIRNPLDVAGSLQRHHGFSLAKSLDLWFTYTMASLRGTEGARRIFVFYKDYFYDLHGTLRRLAAFLGNPALADDPETLSQAQAFAQDQLWHYRSRPADAVDTPEASFALKALYLALHALRHGSPDDGEPWREINEALSVLCDCIDDERRAALRTEALIESQRAALAEQAALVATWEARLAERDARCAAAEAALQELQRRVQAMESSAVHRLWEGARRRIDRAFPAGSRRARPYAAAVRFLQRRGGSR